MSPNPTLRELAPLCAQAQKLLAKFKDSLGAEAVPEALGWCDDLTRRLTSCQKASEGLVKSYLEIADAIEKECEATDFSFLFDPERKLLHIGYNVDTERLDDNYYDLLASESRLASLVAIAKGDLPLSHWLHLGRPLAALQGRATLLSWSGTMFEYLMPTLLMRRYGGTLLEQSSGSAIDVQRQYGQKKGVPWGISESSYGRVDGSGTYQYRAFGVPELALNRGQDNDLVIAPYASALALRIRPGAVIENFARLEKVGALGPYGFYEALDYTPSRKPLDADYLLVRSYMAHHQGMALVELGNALSDDAMVRRFHSNARIATVELLLQERVPTQVPTESRLEREPRHPGLFDASAYERPWPARLDGLSPSTHLLSNGNYSVLLNAAGGGYSRAGDDAITRWHSDGTLNDNGTWIYLRDLDDGELWSVTQQPLGGPPESAQVDFSPSKVVFNGINRGISSRLEVCVAEHDAELRRLTLVNQRGDKRRLKLTSYAEVVLGDEAGDQRHPAFSKLFVESSYDPETEALIFRRRPRSDDENPRYAAHLLLLPGGIKFSAEYETDRAKFLGRGHDTRSADGPRGTLSGTVGATLDPVMALGQELILPPHSQTTLTFVIAHAPTRSELLSTIKRLRGAGMVEREFEQARSRSRIELRRNRITVDSLEQYQRVLSALVYPSAGLRAPEERLAGNTLGQSSLWGQGISGDYPILVARVEEQEELPLVADLVTAHGYWRRRGYKVDVVVLNTKASAYSQELQGRLRWLLSRTGGDDWLDTRGGIYLLRQDQLAPVDQVLLDTVARVTLDAADGPLAAQLDRAAQLVEAELPLHRPERASAAASTPVPRPSGLLFDNGWGGFSPDGREYQIYLDNGELPPAPWTNVVANAEFGFMVTEGGLGASWSINSGENRLTPWRNDPVTDSPAEVVYLRDEQSGEVWSATPLPSKSGESFLVRHGAGYTVYQHNSHGLNQELELFAAADDPVKVVRLKVDNTTGSERRVTVTYYAPWILGIDHDATQLYVIPSYDAERCALLATNPYNSEFGERVAFLASNKSPHGLTTDRREFLGANGSLVTPAGLKRIGLSGSTHAGSDPCAVLQIHLDLEANGSEEVVFALGQAENRDQALDLADRYRNVDNVAAARSAMNAKWDGLLDQLIIDTPDAAMNVLTNRWLNYQTLSARLWGRSAFYQSSGAYGFRDQLQDVLALIHTAPQLARDQLLRAAAHQFQEGDVLHWWHPPSGRGVRTRISDDLLWLVYVTSEYVSRTGDSGVLDEQVAFLQGAILADGEDERYDHYQQGESGTLLEHCLRALKKGATEGRHGLPLMGGGDWNDGMNRVGIKGQGESVWLGWFLITTIGKFAPVLAAAGQQHEAEQWKARAEKYRTAIEANAWDGNWYLRAYYDDGSPLGSHSNEECTIDSIAQSWAVLSGAGDAQRTRQALAKVDELLVRDQDHLIRLFTPAFDKTPRDPGYIKGYLPGVRENGGQYTHGAIWTAWAFAAQGNGERAHELYSLLNPICHSQDEAATERYKVEPYVTAADVYSVDPHVGRGGWTWYTGSAAWYYRFAVEAILGVNREGSLLTIDPVVPKKWPGFSLRYREGKSTYKVVVDNSAGVNGGVKSLTVDGAEQSGAAFELVDDGADHEVLVVLG